MGTSRPYLQALRCNATAGDVMTRVFMLSIISRDAKKAFEWIAEVIKSCALCRFMRVGMRAIGMDRKRSASGRGECEMRQDWL